MNNQDREMPIQCSQKAVIFASKCFYDPLPGYVSNAGQVADKPTTPLVVESLYRLARALKASDDSV
jgi:hypothetical protein